MPRGGRREGAGRKPGSTVLDPRTRCRIGADASRAWHEACAEARRARNKLPALVDIEEQRKVALNIPVSKRKEWTASPICKTYTADMEVEREALKAHRISVSPPPGGKTRIYKDLAEKWSEKLGRDVSARMVRSCWETVQNLADEAELTPARDDNRHLKKR